MNIKSAIADPVPTAARGQHRYWPRLLSSSPVETTGFLMVLFIIGLAILAPWIAPFDPDRQFSGMQLVPMGTDGHLLGTDELSRDILSRVIYGTRVSVFAGFVSVTVGALLGSLLGMIAGMFGRFFDTVIMRGCDLLLAYPGILLGIVVVAVLGPGLIQVCVAVAFVNIPVFARLMRSAVLKERELEYVNAAIVQGASNSRILFLHIFPNSIGIVITQISAAAGHAVLLEASLSFLGLGVQPPIASWGSMLSKSRPFLEMAPMYALAPGFMLLVMVLGLNLSTDAIQRWFDPARNRR